MRVVDGRPPNFESIVAVFPGAKHPGVIFTFGGTIYAPGFKDLPVVLRAHEGVHFSRQTATGMTPDRWWDRYLVDVEYRLDEELKAHRAEYRSYCDLTKSREDRIRYLHTVGAKLAAPLYGAIITAAEARRRILN
jgi:hypothetical protein